MEYNDYPALYRIADTASIRCQDRFMMLMKSYILTLILAALFSYIGINSTTSAILAAILFLCTIGISIFLIVKQYQKKWYNLRAVAESVKTLTWRYMMCAEPYSKKIGTKEVKYEFCKTLSKIIKQNSTDAEEFRGDLSKEDQLTSNMNQIRESELEKRKNFYLEYRIKEQRNWYSKKTVINQKDYKYWVIFMILIQVLAAVTVLLRIAKPEFIYFPTEVMAVTAGGILSWIQIKKYQELSAAYSLASLEIGTLQSCISEISNDDEFSEFVIDSENAFSREHTQWVAKRI